MSDDGAENGSSTGGNPDSPRRKTSIDDVGLPNHSATTSYIDEPETYEQFALGETTSDPDAAVEKHCEKMKEEIKEKDEKLDADKGSGVDT